MAKQKQKRNCLGCVYKQRIINRLELQLQSNKSSFNNERQEKLKTYDQTRITERTLRKN